MRKKFSLLALTAALVVTSCGSSAHHSSAAAPTTASTAAASATTTSPSTATPGTSTTATTPPPGITPPATTPPVTSVVGTGPAPCATPSLSGRLTGENGTAGSTYYVLLVTNTGAAECTLDGFPGVSWVTGSSGAQVGAAAARDPVTPARVALGPGGTAGAVLQITEAGNYGPICRLTPTDGLRVYPPGQTTALLIVHSDEACANASDVTLHVGPFTTSG
jgi:hypothetical protein